MRIPNSPQKCNASYHLCHIILDIHMENELVKGGGRDMLPSFSCIEHPRMLDTTSKGKKINDNNQKP